MMSHQMDGRIRPGVDRQISFCHDLLEHPCSRDRIDRLGEAGFTLGMRLGVKDCDLVVGILPVELQDNRSKFHAVGKGRGADDQLTCPAVMMFPSMLDTKHREEIGTM